MTLILSFTIVILLSVNTPLTFFHYFINPYNDKMTFQDPNTIFLDQFTQKMQEYFVSTYSSIFYKTYDIIIMQETLNFFPIQFEENCHQKYIVWILPGNLMLCCLCGVMSFLKKHTNILNQANVHCFFFVKQKTSLIYVKEKSFCLIN